MKQFNLEEYLRLKEEGKEPKIVTRDGRSVRILCTDLKAVGEEVIAALVMELDRCETMHAYHKDGKYRTYRDSSYDLFFADLEEKPKYRPYKDAEECYKEVVKHGGWYRGQPGVYCHICKVTDYGFSGLSFSAIAQCFIWADDGSPCGVKEE